MSKPEPTWQGLPFHLKVYVTETLGYRSRRNLGRCSKSDYALVQTLPFILQTVRFGLSLSGKVRMADGFFSTTYHQSSLNSHPVELVINEFINVIKHPKSTIESVIFNLERSQDNFYSALLTELRTRNLKIKAKKFILNGTYQAKELDNCYEIYLELLGFMDLKKLEMIEIGSIIADDFLAKLVKTEQWKSAKTASMCIAKCDNVNLDDFSHFTQLNLRGFNYMNQENKMKLVENFQQRDHPVNSFFSVSNYIRSFTMCIDDRQSEETFEMPTPGNKLQLDNFQNMIQGRVIGNSEKENMTITELLYHLHC